MLLRTSAWRRSAILPCFVFYLLLSTAWAQSPIDRGAPAGSVVPEDDPNIIVTVPAASRPSPFNEIVPGAGSQLTTPYPNDGGGTPSLALAGASAAETSTAIETSNAHAFVGQAVTLTATVSSPAGQIPNGDIVVFEDVTTTPAVVLTSMTLSGGVAAFITTSLPRGLHLIEAAYLGDSEFAASVSPTVVEIVLRYPTTITVVSNMSQVATGQPVTFTATVNSASGITPPNGESITFSNNGSVIGVATLANGQTSFTAAFAEAGTQYVTASYPGDPNNRISSSLPLTQLVVQAATTTTLISSPNPSNTGQTVTLTATVTGQYGGTPAGTIVFLDGTTPLGTVALSASQAILMKLFPVIGMKSLSAMYSGDANYISSTGTQTQTVEAALPCTAPCFISTTTTFGGLTRYYGAYFPANLPASFTAIVELPGATTAPYNDPTASGSSSSLFVSYSSFVAFANANNVAVLWVMPTAYDASSDGGIPPFAECLTSACNASASWVWQLPSYFTSTGSVPSDLFSYNALDTGYLHSMVRTLTASWGANAVIAIGTSTGGIFLNAYAQQYPGDFEAIGLFAGPLWAQMTGLSQSPVFTTGSNVNVFYTHGSADRILPYCGGATSNPWTGLGNISSASTDQTFNFWAGSGGMNCSTITPLSSICTNGSPTSGVTSKLATGCNGGKSFQFVEVPGGGHLSAASPTVSNISEFWNFAFPQIPAVQPTE